jgi:hypothetical protein
MRVSEKIRFARQNSQVENRLKGGSPLEDF